VAQTGRAVKPPCGGICGAGNQFVSFVLTLFIYVRGLNHCTVIIIITVIIIAAFILVSEVSGFGCSLTAAREQNKYIYDQIPVKLMTFTFACTLICV